MSSSSMSDSTQTANMMEKGKKVDTPPVAVSFFDPALKETRRNVFIQWARTVLMLCVFILCVLSLYWAVQFRVEANLPSLTIWVVDFDGQLPVDVSQRSNQSIVGPAITNLADRIANSDTHHLGYTIKSPAEFQYSLEAVRQGIYDEHAYAAIIVNPNATTLLRHAVTNGNDSYDPSDAAQFVVISARDQSTYSSYITPALNEFELTLRSEFGPQWITSLAQQESVNLSRTPQAVNPAIGFNTLDLRPFAPAVATPSVTIGLIYLIIIAFFNFPFLMPIHAQFTKGGHDHPPLKIPHPNAYGRGSFVVFWMLNWVGMSALGFPCENMAMILGFPWSSLFLIFWVITNVSTGFYALDLAPGFFAWGYAWPLHRIVEALRTILFGAHSRIGLDFGILFAWIGVSIALFPFASLVMKWRMQRGL
ncbi:hypothetical protein AOCH_006909 [Aspergillus ochraceoroseus]|uniref:DUF3533 domain-containing protein n=1 Tax=Aspergillus ochraceoroseus TaxID=138278 RepID=A0A0F8V0Q2_9EURO|nr:hypothetical protein AOCH_006909 [Aspergillus ochraceoroseus]